MQEAGDTVEGSIRGEALKKIRGDGLEGRKDP